MCLGGANNRTSDVFVRRKQQDVICVEEAQATGRQIDVFNRRKQQDVTCV
jgi:hypothetical protein